MTDQHQIARHAERLEALLAEKFGARRGPLELRVQSAGRRLPRRVRRDLGEVARAQQFAGHPKLGRQIDGARVRAAARRAEDWLVAVDVADRRKGFVLSLLGSLSFNLILLFAILVAVLRWRGYV